MSRNPKPELPDLPREQQPWLDEPDYRMFEAAGMVCMVRRVWSGNLCGYVGVGRSHPLYQVGARDLVPAPDTWTERPFNVDEHGVIETFLTVLEHNAGDIPDGFAPLSALISVHGGLTWAAPIHDHTGWWFGFDCGHAGDISPGLIATVQSVGLDTSHYFAWGSYRTFDYVVSETATLAQQIADWTAKIPHVEAAREAIERLRVSLPRE